MGAVILRGFNNFCNAIDGRVSRERHTLGECPTSAGWLCLAPGGFRSGQAGLTDFLEYYFCAKIDAAERFRITERLTVSATSLLRTQFDI
jgi:hypothetical protein